MSFAENIMAAGSWSVTLDERLPRAVRDAVSLDLAAFSQIIITDTHVDPGDLGDAGMLSVARYAGIYRGQRGSELSGAGMPVLLGDEDGKGAIVGSHETATGSLAEWYTELTDAESKVEAGGSLTTVGGLYPRTLPLTNYRQAWDSVCEFFGVEYRLNPDRTLDVGTAAVLYGTPSVVILGASSGVAPGRDVALTGVAASVTLERDAEDLTTRVVYVTGTEEAPVLTGAGTTHPTLREPSGDPLSWKRLVEAYNDDSGEEATMAAMQLGRFDDLRLSWDVAVETDMGRVAPVGSPVYLYDPQTGLLGGASITFCGEQIEPVESRVMAMETPIIDGMGVYLRRATDTSGGVVWTDLTPYVIAETGGQRITLGSLPRPSR